MRARDYDPTLGRFLSRDPFPGALDKPRTFSPYGFGFNDPVNLF